MAYDHELILVSYSGFTTDDDGNDIPTKKEKAILCDEKSVTRSEFYSAATSGLKPSNVFVIHRYEYEGEQEVIFEGENFNVLRTYAINFEELELTCEKVAGNG